MTSSQSPGNAGPENGTKPGRDLESDMGKKGVLATPEDTQVVECAAKRAVSVRQGLIIAGVLLLACGGLVGYGILNTEDEPKAQAVPTAEVTYEVTGTGTAEISYLAPSQSGTATVEKGATLPWKKTVQVPVGKAPTVAIILDERGGEAVCALAVRGKHAQRASAMGAFGRATCSGPLLQPVQR